MAWRILNMADFSPFPELLEPLRKFGEVISLPPEQKTLRQRIGEFDAYLASLHVQADRETLLRATRLKVIATPSTGLDHLDLETIKERGVKLLSLRFDREFLDSITATAEMAWCLLLAVVRKLPWAFSAACRGDWARDRFRGHQLSGKTLGILGYGRLGRMVAQYGLAFRMRVLACDIEPVEPAAGVEMVDFERLLAESDVLSVHIHLDEKNRHLINASALSRMKPNAILINTSRGGVIDEEALLEALRSGHLGGAGLDVIEGEWRSDLDRHPLIEYAREHENLVISPHLGGVTFESQRAAFSRIVEMLVEFLKTTKGSTLPQT